jgi:predicted GNAT superfamily acetyltransferase
MIRIETPATASDMAVVGDLMATIWGSAVPLVSVEMLMAISHAGGYVCIAYEHDSPRPVGASLGLLAQHAGAPALHSHITGVVPAVRGTGLGRTIKLHQRAWAAAHGIERIVWTFDPLVRRNAWFNIAVLGVEVIDYLPSFYGPMTDGINAGDDSDRLFVAWDVRGELPDRPLDGSRLVGDGHDLIPTPADIVALRRTDPAGVAQWRADTRSALTEALDAGRPIVGFTAAGEYVIGSMP